MPEKQYSIHCIFNYLQMNPGATDFTSGSSNPQGAEELLSGFRVFIAAGGRTALRCCLSPNVAQAFMPAIFGR
jgi:hypothetical protein